DGRRLPPASETEPMDGAPFLALAAHHSQGSVFLLGGTDSVRIMQVRESKRLACAQLAEVRLDGEVPVWLRPGGGPLSDQAGDGEPHGEHAAAGRGGGCGEGAGAVLAV
ncbi:unnamed protein product, partial [Prorocentrum cordatum]